MTAEGAAAEADSERRKQPRSELVADLAKKFGIDHDGLAATVNAAAQAFYVARDGGPGGVWSVAEADALDFLKKARLPEIADRLEQLEGTLAEATGYTDDEIYAVAVRLRKIAGTVADEEKIPRHPTKDGRGDDLGPHRKMYPVVKSYWEALGLGEAKGRQFVGFARPIFEHIAPGSGDRLGLIAKGPRGSKPPSRAEIRKENEQRAARYRELAANAKDDPKQMEEYTKLAEEAEGMARDKKKAGPKTGPF